MDLRKIFDQYGEAVKVERVCFDATEMHEMKEISNALTLEHWNDPNLNRHDVARLRKDILKDDGACSEKVQTAKQIYQDNGAVVLSLDQSSLDGDLDILKKQLATLLVSFGMPFGAFKQKGFWQTLGVDPNAAELRAASTGYIPLHVDFDQAVSPPDAVALFCLRPDPLGGGDSIVFDYQRFLNLISDEDRAFLSGFEYSYSTLYEQNGIGDVYNPHPLLETVNGGDFLRYNGKVLPELSGAQSDMFQDLEVHFRAASSIYPLHRGDMIIVDQNKVLHGREALAPRRKNDVFSAGEDRFLLQTYVRHGL